MLKTGCASLALLAISVHPALSACANAGDVAALKTAVLQQELMVAALQCHEAGAYNRFVIAYRGELQASDAALKSFFIKRGGEHGEAGYDSFKTKAANLSGLEQARDTRAFCADAHALFAAAARNDSSLAQFVADRSAPLDVGGVCAEARPVLAAARLAPTRAPALVRVADVRGDVAVGGVPDHALPVRPFGRSEAPVVAHQDQDDLDDTETDDQPPPRAYRIREERDGDEDRYGPPPGWRRAAYRAYAPPPPRWYQRDRYYGW